MFGIADSKTNNTLFYVGYVATFLLPPVGFFDCDAYPVFHPCLAMGFFIC